LQLPLETTSYVSVTPEDKAEMGNPNSKHVMNFETSKDIFESSGQVINL